MRIPSGKTDQAIFFVGVDATDLKTREINLAAFTVYRSRNGGTLTAYTTPTVTQLSAANSPGVYALLVDEDTTIAASSDSEEYMVHITCVGMAPVTRTIELYRRDTTTGRTAAIDASGRIDLGLWRGVAPNDLLAGRIDTWPILVRTSNCQAGNTTTTVRLDVAASSVDDFYAGMLIRFIGGTGTGQQSNITAYDGVGKLATIAPIATPADPSTVFAIVGLPGLVAAASTDVYNQVVQAIATDTYPEPGQGAPPAAASFKDKVGYLYKFARNKLTNDGGTTKVFADDGVTVDQKAVVTETSGLVTRQKFGAGP